MKNVWERMLTLLLSFACGVGVVTFLALLTNAIVFALVKCRSVRHDQSTDW